MYDIFGENTQNNPGGFDSMLEILPEELDVNLVTSFANSASGDSSRAQSQQPTHTHEQEMDSLFSITQPIDLVNHQNGEIAQLWSFNVDEFMMTPNNSSDSATISAPNSYNSESQSHPHTSNNWSHLLSNPFHQETGAQHLFANSQGNLRTDDQSFHPTLPTKRSSSQLTKAMTDDGGIPLTSSGTVNSVRKNSITRPISSTSLSSYRQNSVQELPKKPQVQCFNCKTFKTPLWRRDAQGNTLCNACGLFQKLHGTMRPLSLKSDVIRKRNTKKRSKKVVTADPNDKPRPRKKLEQDSLQELPVPLPSTPITTTSTGGNKKTTSQTLYNNIPTLMTGSRSSSSTNITGGNVSFNTGSSSMPSTQLNSNVLMNHNKRMFSNSGNGSSRKSRRSSTSSSTSNSSNRSSSSRSVVPILPKPSPGNTTTSQNQFQFVNNIPGSANNSGASSPRFSNSPRASFSTTSPLSSSTGQVLSSSGGRLGIVIPRRKSSRQMMSSSSFMAASLQQHHQQQQQQQQQPPPQQANQQTNVAGSSSSTISAPSSWSSTAITAPSPKTGRSPRSPFDLFSPQEPQSRPSSRKSHTSLLSQQLQQATILSQYSQPSSQSQTPVSYPNGANSTASTPQPSTLKRSPMTASPRNSYVDSIQQQRGLHSDGRLENSYRRASSLRVETNEKNSQNSHKQKENVMDDLEWLKFGL